MSESLRAEVASAASAQALLELTRRALADAPLGERELVRQIVARHGRHWDLPLARYLAVIPPEAEVCASQSLFLGGLLGEAVTCVDHMQGVYSFITGMAQRHWRGRMKALIAQFRLSAVSWPGRAIFAIALDRPRSGPRNDEWSRDDVGTRARVACSWLLEFDDVPEGWLEALRVVRASDAGMAVSLAHRPG